MRKFTMRLIGTLCAVFLIAGPVSAAQLLVPVGQVIGLELTEDRVVVDGFDGRFGGISQAAGLKAGDQILKIDKREIRCAEDVRLALESSDGDVDLLVLRDGELKTLELEPAITEDGPKLGIFLRQGITGVGTVTYYDPES